MVRKTRILITFLVKQREGGGGYLLPDGLVYIKYEGGGVLKSYI